MATRLDNLVLVLAPVLIQRGIDAGKLDAGPDELRRFVSGIVGLAHMIEQAIADEELRQMTPPKGQQGGP